MILHPEIASADFQILEDLATGAWHSELLFAALELGVFEALSTMPGSSDDLAVRLDCDCCSLSRLLEALTAFGLIIKIAGRYENGPLASRYLVPDGATFAGHFLDYRRFLARGWRRLASRVKVGASANNRVEDAHEVYEQRVFTYVRALDFQARLKAAEAVERPAFLTDIEPRRILDIGGGAGAWSRTLLGRWPQAHAVLLELPEVLSAAVKLHPAPASWNRIECIAGNALTSCFRKREFDLVVLSNVLHAYGGAEASRLLANAADALAQGGRILIHDYLADDRGTRPLKGRLYDLHMMLNTYNGRIYSLAELYAMLDGVGFRNSRLLHLQTDTSIILASRQGADGHKSFTYEEEIEAQARAAGFSYARVVDADSVAVECWVRIKCERGCPRYGVSLTCPPHSPDEEEMRRILAGYTHALFVQGTPPSRRFHEQLLALERSLLIDGHPEALAFGAGPCPVCAACPPDGRCRYPDLARPSLEACGVDVYETARRAGRPIAPVRRRDDYVRYVGIVLFKR